MNSSEHPGPVNDNTAPDSREQFLVGLLRDDTVLETHMTTSLQAMLAANNVSQKVRDGVAEFMRPAVEILGRLEAEAIKFARRQPPDVTPDSVRDQLAMYAADMASVAYSPLQMKLAASFAEFVSGLEPRVEVLQPDLGLRKAAPLKADNDAKRDEVARELDRMRGLDGPTRGR